MTQMPAQEPSSPAHRQKKKKNVEKDHNSRNNWRILPLIQLDLYFMIIYLCIKFDSNTLIFSKDIEWKPFLFCTG